MDQSTPPAYGSRLLVIINSLVFTILASSFAKPQSPRDRRSFGVFSAFLVALFTEIYGFPLMIYLLSGWLSAKFPGANFMSYDTGRLLEAMFGWCANPRSGPFHLLSAIFIGGGFRLLSAAWAVLYHNQRSHMLATTGAYSHIRHPQYVGFVLIMFGSLLQQPTTLTLLMFPVLVVMYVYLAITEERQAGHEFGEEWAHYVLHTPRFIPNFGDKQADRYHHV